jgi:hypothetical protein
VERNKKEMTEKLITFEYLISPERWKQSAEMLKTTAYKLEIYTDKQRGSIIVEDGIRPVYYMLIGFGLENYLKGVIKASSNEHEKISTSGKLNSPTHDLVELNKIAKIWTDKNSVSIIRHLTEYTTWEGRYPSPINAGKINGIKFHPAQDNESYSMLTAFNPLLTIEELHKLIDQAAQRLETLIKDA